ncbi:hypothetical protein ABT117_38890, partial [Streptomyces sp. NPDC002262]
MLLGVAVLGEQLQQDLVARRIVGDVPLGQQLAGVVDQGDVVGPFRLVDSAVDQDSPPQSSVFALVTSACGPRSALIPDLGRSAVGPPPHLDRVLCGEAVVETGMGRGTWSWIVPDGLWEIAKPLIPPSKTRPQG